jgi:hypothetical protein
VPGKSLLGFGISPGDRVVVVKSDELKPRQLMLVHTEVGVLLRLVENNYLREGEVTLISGNSAYGIQELPRDAVTILGYATHVERFSEERATWEQVPIVDNLWSIAESIHNLQQLKIGAERERERLATRKTFKQHPGCVVLAILLIWFTALGSQEGNPSLFLI